MLGPGVHVNNCTAHGRGSHTSKPGTVCTKKLQRIRSRSTSRKVDVLLWAKALTICCTENHQRNRRDLESRECSHCTGQVLVCDNTIRSFWRDSRNWGGNKSEEENQIAGTDSLYICRVAHHGIPMLAFHPSFVKIWTRYVIINGCLPCLPHVNRIIYIGTNPQKWRLSRTRKLDADPTVDLSCKSRSISVQHYMLPMYTRTERACKLTCQIEPNAIIPTCVAHVQHEALRFEGLK